MGKLWLPDSRLEMPELLEPGRKPSGMVKIDWNHKYATKDLVYSQVGGQELVSKGTRAVESDGVFFAGEDSAEVSPNPLGTGNDVHVVCRVKVVDADDQYNAFFFVGHYISPTDQSGIWLAKNSNDRISALQRANADSSEAVSTEVYSAGDIIDVQVLFTYGGKVYLTVNKAETESIDTLSRVDIATPDVRVGRAGASRRISVEYIHVYAAQNDMAVNSLTTDPYQFLIPS